MTRSSRKLLGFHIRPNGYSLSEFKLRFLQDGKESVKFTAYEKAEYFARYCWWGEGLKLMVVGANQKFPGITVVKTTSTFLAISLWLDQLSGKDYLLGVEVTALDLNLQYLISLASEVILAN